MNTKELIRSTFGTVAALTIIIFVIVYLAYGCADIKDQLKEALTLTIGFLSGLATLGAAYIAANLFNDWKEQHNKTVLARDARDAFKLLHNERNILLDLNLALKKMLGKKPANFFTVNDKNMDDLITNLLNQHNTNRLELAEFVYLIEDTEIHKQITDYRGSIDKLVSDVITWKTELKKYDDMVEIYAANIKGSRALNGKVLNTLKSYILYKSEALT